MATESMTGIPCKPLHPGEILRNDVLPALGVGVGEAAKQLGISRVNLSKILYGRYDLSAEMCVRLEWWLGADNGGNAETWMEIQGKFDLHQARQNLNARVAG